MTCLSCEDTMVPHNCPEGASNSDERDSRTHQSTAQIKEKDYQENDD